MPCVFSTPGRIATFLATAPDMATNPRGWAMAFFWSHHPSWRPYPGIRGVCLEVARSGLGYLLKRCVWGGRRKLIRRLKKLPSSALVDAVSDHLDNTWLLDQDPVGGGIQVTVSPEESIVHLVASNCGISFEEARNTPYLILRQHVRLIRAYNEGSRYMEHNPERDDQARKILDEMEEKCTSGE